ncbi:MAG: signal peptidase [Candidatus Marinimicrobia bacterium]|jgi:signal peptidase II|nr:signal peptidase [Candidatus Neomarinimicrobiota bacterium]
MAHKILKLSTRRIRFALIVICVVLLDQWTKVLTRSYFSIPVRNPIHLLGNNLIITRVENHGIAFGIHFPGIHIISYLGFMVIILYLFYQYRRETYSLLNDIAFSLIIGGALGNFYDRLFRGTVTDMIQMGISGYYWPVYNIADSAITIGVLLFILGTFLRNRQTKHADG